MHTMDKSLKELHQKGLISIDMAMSKVKSRDEFKQL